jgi:DNA-binding response OmpR family regulator
MRRGRLQGALAVIVEHQAAQNLLLVLGGPGEEGFDLSHPHRSRAGPPIVAISSNEASTSATVRVGSVAADGPR